MLQSCALQIIVREKDDVPGLDRRVERVLGECGIPKTEPPVGVSLSNGWRHAAEPAEPSFRNSSGAGIWAMKSSGRNCWPKMGGKRGADHFGGAVHESAEAKAERILKTELKRMEWGQGKKT
jgi:hypothetical protein